MKFPNKHELEMLRKKYPVGTKIRLEFMDDTFAPESGTVGVVTHVDDIGSIHMKWKSGSSLALIEGVDDFEILSIPGGSE